MKLSAQTTSKILIGLLCGVILFHLCVLIGIIPANIVWGGQFSAGNAIYILEISSILMNTCLIWVLLLKGNWLKISLSHKAIHFILQIFLFLFILNTLGNLLAKSLLERFFALLTALITWLLWKVIQHKV